MEHIGQEEFDNFPRECLWRKVRKFFPDVDRLCSLHRDRVHLQGQVRMSLLTLVHTLAALFFPLVTSARLGASLRPLRASIDELFAASSRGAMNSMIFGIPTAVLSVQFLQLFKIEIVCCIL